MHKRYNTIIQIKGMYVKVENTEMLGLDHELVKQSSPINVTVVFRDSIFLTTRQSDNGFLDEITVQTLLPVNLYEVSAARYKLLNLEVQLTQT